MTLDILTIKVPVPIPCIKHYSRWQVFLALFNPHAHFTTCEALEHELRAETARWLDGCVKNYNKRFGL